MLSRPSREPEEELADWSQSSTSGVGNDGELRLAVNQVPWIRGFESLTPHMATTEEMTTEVHLLRRLVEAQHKVMSRGGIVFVGEDGKPVQHLV